MFDLISLVLYHQSDFMSHLKPIKYTFKAFYCLRFQPCGVFFYHKNLVNYLGVVKKKWSSKLKKASQNYQF